MKFLLNQRRRIQIVLNNESHANESVNALNNLVGVFNLEHFVSKL